MTEMMPFNFENILLQMPQILDLSVIAIIARSVTATILTAMITPPRGLMDARLGNPDQNDSHDDVFFVLVDGEEVEYRSTCN